jgi:hypothetical protein
MSSPSQSQGSPRRLLSEVAKFLALKVPLVQRLDAELNVSRSEIKALAYQIEAFRSQIKSLEANSVPIDRNKVEVLDDPEFQNACQTAASLTLLDIPRLANIWQLLRMSNPDGNIAELGVFRGGCSVFMAKAAPKRHLFLCDTFEGFGNMPIDPSRDAIFKRTDFDNTSTDLVLNAMSQVTTNFELIRGYFPASDMDNRVRDISFAHVDLDLYESTLSSLRYLSDRAINRSIFVLDDFQRGATGVMEAVAEFLASDDRFVVFPLFPGQGVMLHKSWWKKGV